MMRTLGVLVVCFFLLVLSSFGVQAQSAINMEFRNAPLTDIYKILGEIGGFNVILDPSVQGTVSFYLKDLSLREALDLVSRTSGYGYTLLDNTLIVASPERLRREFEEVEYSFVQLRSVGVDEAIGLLRIVASDLSVFSDKKRNLLVLFGRAPDIQLARRVIDQYDTGYIAVEASPSSTPQEVPEPEILFTYRMPVDYANGEAILSFLGLLYPDRSLRWDPVFRTLIAVTTEEEWVEMQRIVAEKDYPSFHVRGMVSSGEIYVLLEHQGSTQLVTIGQTFQGWVLTMIHERTILMERNGKKLTLEMRR